MSFWNDVGYGFGLPFVWIYNKVKKVDHMVDNAMDSTSHVVSSVGSIAGGIGDVLSGRSNMLLYIGLGLLAVVVVPVILEKVL